ncbi:MAG TPA: flagellar hook protein FlgE, partial [Acidimicrobiales bacterium]|nr:flagellar hook protein FlgE [Acidimicrobiales bacterium]
MESLSAAISGIEANQTMIDTVGNNIANVNTPGYAAVDVQFQDLLSQQLSGAGAATPTTGGVNPTIIGSGTRVATTRTSFVQGSLQQTGQPTDVAIQGPGFLIANKGGSIMYTRAGNLSLDALGHLVTSDGGLIQGWAANASGVVNVNGPTTALTIPQGQLSTPVATQNINLTGNLEAWSGSGTANPVTISINAYDALGAVVPVTLTLTPKAGAAGTWDLQGSVPNPGGGPATQLWGTPQSLVFTNGQLATVNGTAVAGATSLAVTTMPAGYNWAGGATLSVDLPAPGTTSAVTQLASPSTMEVGSQDGVPSGGLQSFSIGPDGTISGTFSSGTTQKLGQLALASFANNEGLFKAGNGYYQSTVNSGNAQVGTPGTGGRGSTEGGALETSNVDLAKQLTDLIVAQNAYQANTKVLTTSDQVL